MQAEVRIMIDKLVVEGLDAPNARVFGRAFEIELGRLIESGGVPPSLERSGDRGPLEIDNFVLTRETRPETAGRQFAAKVYQELKG